MPPSGVVTFLFTDIEGSTRRWEADADAMRAALLAHDTVLRVAIEAHSGFLFGHTGDGVVAAFASPKSAVDAAVAAQLELELPVRMGLATGEAELRDGDYFGTVLNRAARVMAAGHGGQILLADSTAGVLSGVGQGLLGGKRLLITQVKPRGGDLEKISALIEAGKLRTVIEKVFSLEQMADAHRLSETGHVRGKIAVKISS